MIALMEFQEWISPDYLRNQYKINYVEDDWYVGCFLGKGTTCWAYIVKLEAFFRIMEIRPKTTTQENAGVRSCSLLWSTRS